MDGMETNFHPLGGPIFPTNLRAPPLALSGDPRDDILRVDAPNGVRLPRPGAVLAGRLHPLRHLLDVDGVDLQLRGLGEKIVEVLEIVIDVAVDGAGQIRGLADPFVLLGDPLLLGHLLRELVDQEEQASVVSEATLELVGGRSEHVYLLRRWSG